MTFILLVGLALADEAAWRPALQAELDRSLSSLRIEGEAAPYYVAYDLIDGQYTTTYAEFGAVIQDEDDVLRQLRVEVRTGDAKLDSANFDAFGEPDGVLTWNLPEELDGYTLRRYAWLATDRAYKQAVEQLSRKEAALGPPEPDAPPALSPAQPVTTPPATPPPLQGEIVREAVVKLSAILAEYPTLESGQAAGRDWQGVRVTVNSEGTALSRPTGFAVVRVEAVLKHEDGTRLRNGRWWVADTAAELPPLDAMAAEVRAMAEHLLSLAAAPTLEEYLGPVLFEGPAAVELFRQLAAAEFVGTPPLTEGPDERGGRKEPRSTGRIGRRLLPEGWTVVDDPTLAAAVGDYAYDHDGVPAQRVLLVEDGVVQDLLRSRIPASPDETSNGHGRALGSDRRTALPAVVSVTPKRARSTRALERKALRMAAQTGREEVLVIRRLEPPEMTEDFDIFFTGEGPPPGLTPAYEAYLLRADGSRSPVRGVAFSGVDRRVLRDIAMAGEPGPYVGLLDAEPGPGRFHIGAVGGLPASWSVPPVLVGELEVVGNQGGDKREIPAPTPDGGRP